MPRVSIVTPCFNAARFIGETIESVVRQTLEDWEYIIVDDGSTDAGRCVVEPFLRDERIRLRTQQRGGVASARNRGFADTSPESDYVMFLDADDTIHETMLESMVRQLDRYPRAGLASCGFVWLDEDGNEDERGASIERLAPGFPFVRQVPEDEPVTPFASLYAPGGLVPTMSTVFRRAVYSETAGFDEAFGQGFEDSDLVLRVAVLSDALYVNERLYRYRRRAGQHSSDQQLLSRQYEKLFAKLRALEGNPESRKRLAMAEDFRRGPYAAYRILCQSRALFQRRQWIGAVKRFVRALAVLTSPATFRVWLARERAS